MSESDSNGVSIDVKNSKNIYDYIEHWTTIPSPPVSIGWIEALVNKIKKGLWRPDLDEVVDNKLIINNQHTFENLIPDYNPDEESKYLVERIEKAQSTEAKHRIFRSIYWGNLYDDIMPIEARYYYVSTDRVPKIVIMILVVLFFLLTTTILPSILYDRYDIVNAFRNSQESPFFRLKGNHSFVSRASQELNVKFGSNDSYAYYGGDTLKLAWAIKHDTDDILFNSNLSSVKTDNWFNDPTWIEVSERVRKQFIFKAVFVERLLSDSDVFNDLNSKYNIVVTPKNNYPEILSQVVVVVLIVMLINFFLSKKSHFSQVIDHIDHKMKPLSVIYLEEILLSFFYNRKKYHYSIAFVVASMAVFFHYYAMDMHHQMVSMDLVKSLGVSGYDYRLSDFPESIHVIYWIVQFIILYKLILVVWELGSLNRCMRLWQVKLLKLKIIDKDQLEKIFLPIGREQKNSLRSIAIGFFAVLGFMSYLKMQGLEWHYTPISTYGIDNIISSFKSIFVWQNWYAVYYWSPPVLTVFLLGFALKPCFVKYEQVEEYSKRVIPDIDQMINDFCHRIKNLSVAVSVIQKVQEGLAPDPDKTDSSGEELESD